MIYSTDKTDELLLLSPGPSPRPRLPLGHGEIQDLFLRIWLLDYRHWGSRRVLASLDIPSLPHPWLKFPRHRGEVLESLQ